MSPHCLNVMVKAIAPCAWCVISMLLHSTKMSCKTWISCCETNETMLSICQTSAARKHQTECQTNSTAPTPWAPKKWFVSSSLIFIPTKQSVSSMGAFNCVANKHTHSHLMAHDTFVCALHVVQIHSEPKALHPLSLGHDACSSNAQMKMWSQAPFEACFCQDSTSDFTQSFSSLLRWGHEKSLCCDCGNETVWTVHKLCQHALVFLGHPLNSAVPQQSVTEPNKLQWGSKLRFWESHERNWFKFFGLLSFASSRVLHRHTCMCTLLLLKLQKWFVLLWFEEATAVFACCVLAAEKCLMLWHLFSRTQQGKRKETPLDGGQGFFIQTTLMSLILFSTCSCLWSACSHGF